MKMRLVVLFLIPVSAALAAEPLPLIEGADPLDLFKYGLGVQLGFEMGGLTVRFIRNLRASATVDLSG